MLQNSTGWRLMLVGMSFCLSCEDAEDKDQLVNAGLLRKLPVK